MISVYTLTAAVLSECDRGGSVGIERLCDALGATRDEATDALIAALRAGFVAKRRGGLVATSSGARSLGAVEPDDSRRWDYSDRDLTEDYALCGIYLYAASERAWVYAVRLGIDDAGREITLENVATPTGSSR